MLPLEVQYSDESTLYATVVNYVTGYQVQYRAGRLMSSCTVRRTTGYSTRLYHTVYTFVGHL